MKLPRWSVWVAASLLVLMLAGCEGGGGSTTALGPEGIGEDSGGGTGTLSLMLTDAPTDDLKAVYVTIEEVQVHMEDGENGGWETVVSPSPKKTFNLLELVDGVMEQLGVGALEPGTYTQMRLIIGLTADDGENILDKKHPSKFDGNYVIDKDDNYVDLEVPSGVQTGVKLVHPFEIKVDLTTELILDFDAAKSVHKAGNSGKYILKPTIKVIGTYAVLSGIVSDESGIGIEDVRVTAQTYDTGVAEKDGVIFHASDNTESSGSYSMPLPPGDYCIVAAPPYYEAVNEDDFDYAYGWDCWVFNADVDQWASHDFELPVELTGNLVAEISTTENPVTFSIRASGCNAEICEWIEIWPATVDASPGDYTRTFGLPPGSYHVVACTDSFVDAANAEVTSSTVTSVPFALTPTVSP
jgi:hypothetical protein